MAASLPLSGARPSPLPLCPSTWHEVSSRSASIVTEWMENCSPHSAMTKHCTFGWRAGPGCRARLGGAAPSSHASAQTQSVSKLLVQTSGKGLLRVSS